MSVDWHTIIVKQYHDYTVTELTVFVSLSMVRSIRIAQNFDGGKV